MVSRSRRSNSTIFVAERPSSDSVGDDAVGIRHTAPEKLETFRPVNCRCPGVREPHAERTKQLRQ